jgi:hypothetical protein
MVSTDQAPEARQHVQLYKATIPGQRWKALKFSMGDCQARHNSGFISTLATRRQLRRAERPDIEGLGCPDRDRGDGPGRGVCPFDPVYMHKRGRARRINLHQQCQRRPRLWLNPARRDSASRVHRKSLTRRVEWRRTACPPGCSRPIPGENTTGLPWQRAGTSVSTYAYVLANALYSA